MERIIFDRMAELDQKHWWFVARRRILAALIDRVVRPSEAARILEVGCGTGHNLDMLGRFGALDACELDDAARELASSRLGRAVLSAKLPDLSMFAADSYDVVALLDVLEHVPDDRSALNAIATRLRPGGALVVTVPANPWMWSAHDVAHHHFRRYTRKQLKAVLAGSGLELELLSYFNTLLFPLIAAARLAGKAIGRDSADDSMPAAPINALLNMVFGLEAALIGRVPMPFGVSLVAVARRPIAA
jgi:SAM-dependent methyltransferase